MGLNHSPSIVMDGLVLCLDAANRKSYPGLLGNELVSNSVIARIDGVTFNVVRDAVQNIGLTVCSVEAGKTYYIDYLITSYTGTTGASFRINNSGANLSPTIGVGAAGRFNRKFTAVASGSLTLQGDNTGTNLEVDYVSVREVLSGTGLSWFDLSPNQCIGTMTNGPVFSTANGGGMVLDGIDDYATVAAVPSSAAETVIVWAKSATATWNQYGWISSSRTSNGHIIHPLISAKEVSFYLMDSTLTPIQIGSVTPSDITIPHMYCMATNGSTYHRYSLDGQGGGVSTGSITRSATSDQTLYLGKDANIARYGNGTIYCALKYNRLLSDAEIQQNFNAMRGRYGV